MSALDLDAPIHRYTRGFVCCCAACIALDPSRAARRAADFADVFARTVDHRRPCPKCGRRRRRGEFFCPVCKPNGGNSHA